MTLVPAQRVEYVRMTFPTSQVIVDDDFQVRLDITSGLEDLAFSIKENKLQDIPKARLDAEGRPHIIAGHRRFLSIRDVLKWPEVTLDVVKEISEKDAIILTITENVDRRNYSPIEEARAFQAALSKGWTAEQLAAKSSTKGHKHTAEFIERRIKLLALPQKVSTAVHTGKIGVETALEIAEAPGELQEELAHEIGTNSYTLKEAKQIVAHNIREWEEEQEFKKRVSETKFPKCPTCKKPATKQSSEGPEWATCQKFSSWDTQHTWNLKTGQTLAAQRAKENPRDYKEDGSKKIVIRSFRSTLPFPILSKALWNYAMEEALKELKARLKNLTEDDLTLSMGGYSSGGLVIEFSGDAKHLTFRVHSCGKDFGMNVESKNYGDTAGNKSKVEPHGGWEQTQREADRQKVTAQKFLKTLPGLIEHHKKLKTQKQL